MNGWPPWRRHRLDVDDRARDLLAPHDPHGLLDEEERRAHVDVEDLVEALLGGVENVAAVGERGGVDQRVDAAEALVRLGDHVAAVGDLGEIGLDEKGRTARRRDVARDRARPCLALRPQMTSPAAPRSAKSRAMASPSPCVPPVTMAILPLEIGRPAIGWARGRRLGPERILAMGVLSSGAERLRRRESWPAAAVALAHE